jgi:transcriptional regulator with XRE-family HTH domain
MSRLGDAIRKARLAKKMTEKQLGRKCGMAENVIKDIESGRRIIADDQAQRILKLLGADTGLSTELDVLRDGTIVRVLDETRGWYKLRVGTQTGYAAAKYIEITENNPEVN